MFTHSVGSQAGERLHLHTSGLIEVLEITPEEKVLQFKTEGASPLAESCGDVPPLFPGWFLANNNCPWKMCLLNNI
jgi:hypothetical protein